MGLSPPPPWDWSLTFPQQQNWEFHLDIQNVFKMSVQQCKHPEVWYNSICRSCFTGITPPRKFPEYSHLQHFHSVAFS